MWSSQTCCICCVILLILCLCHEWFVWSSFRWCSSCQDSILLFKVICLQNWDENASQWSRSVVPSFRRMHSREWYWDPRWSLQAVEIHYVFSLWLRWDLCRKRKGLSTFSVCECMEWFSLVWVDPTAQWAPGPQPMEWRSRKLMGAWEYRFAENCVRAIRGMRDFHRFWRASLISSSVGLAGAGAHSFATTSTALDLSSPCNHDHVSVYESNTSSSLEMNELPPWRKSVLLSCWHIILVQVFHIWVIWDYPLACQKAKKFRSGNVHRLQSPPHTFQTHRTHNRNDPTHGTGLPLAPQAASSGGKGWQEWHCRLVWRRGASNTDEESACSPLALECRQKGLWHKGCLQACLSLVQ